MGGTAIVLLISCHCGFSVRLYSSDSTHLTTMLPSHHTSSVMGVAYCTETHTLCMLTSDNELWIYSTRCARATWWITLVYMWSARFNPARRVAVISGDEYLSMETLLSSVPPTTIRLHHKADIMNVCAWDALLVLGMIVSPVAIVTSNP